MSCPQCRQPVEVAFSGRVFFPSLVALVLLFYGIDRLVDEPFTHGLLAGTPILALGVSSYWRKGKERGRKLRHLGRLPPASPPAVPSCPYCHQSLASVDLVRRFQLAGRWSFGGKERFLCPFCREPLEPRHLWWSRLVLLVGVSGSMACSVALLMSGWLSRLPSGFAVLLAAPFVVGMFATLRLAKSVVRYEKLPESRNAKSGAA